MHPASVAAKAEHQELAAVYQQQLPPGCPHATHHGAAVKVPPHVALGRQRHCHRGQYYRQQRSQAQKALRPFGDVANLGPRVFQTFDLFATAELGLGPGFVRDHRRPLRRQGAGDS
jgi:hypothetical protein